MGLLSTKQRNTLRILKAKLIEARCNYCEACEVRMALVNIEPDKDKDFAKWSKWHARFKLATDDFYKTFSAYNKAYNTFHAYQSVYYGG